MNNTLSIKKTIVFILFIGFGVLGISQKKINTTQQIIELEEGRKGERILGSQIVDEFTYSLSIIGKGRRSQLVMSKYDEQFKLIKRVDWELEIKNKVFHRMIVLKNSIYIAFNQTDTKKKIVDISAYSLDKNLLKLSSKKVNLFKKTYTKKNHKPKVVMYASHDKLLVYSRVIPKDNYILNTKVLDENLEELWKKEINFNVPWDDTKMEDYELNQNGDVYFVLRRKNKKKDKEKSDYDYFLYTFLDKGGKTTDRELTEIPEFIVDVTLKSTPKDNLVVAGYFNEKIERDWKLGAYFSVLDSKTLKELSYFEKLFSTSLLMQHKSNYIKKRAIRKENKGKETGLDMYFKVNEIIAKDNGGAVMIGEHYHSYTVTTTTTDANGRVRHQTHVDYELDDIIVVSIDANGEIEWEKIIPKIQHSRNSTITSGYVRAVVGDKIYFVFNDHRDNHAVDYTHSSSAFSARKKNIVVSVYEINSEGFLRKDILTDYNKIEGTIVPEWSEQVGDREIILYIFARKRKKKLLMVKFDD